MKRIILDLALGMGATLLVLGTGSLGARVQADDSARLERVVSSAGAGKASGLKIVGPEGEQKSEIGLQLHPGDRLITDSKTAGRIVYPDGTELMLGRDTEVKLNEGQWHTLEKGRIRAWIPKKNLSPAKKKYRSGTRTRAAVMGVRGTEYVAQVQQEGQEMLLRVLEGQVDVALSEKNLADGILKQLARGKSQKVTEAQPLPDATSIDAQGVLHELEQTDPELVRIGVRRARAFKSVQAATSAASKRPVPAMTPAQQPAGP
jgi:hypothetical protein